MIRLAFILCCALLVAPASAQLYKWKDASGIWQYSDKPPTNGQKAERVTQQHIGVVTGSAPSPAAAAPAIAPKSAAEREQDFRKRKMEDEEAQKKLAKGNEEKQNKEENCRNAKQSLASLESGQRQMRTDANGERRFLEDPEIQTETGKMRQQVAKWCS
jgi:Skp family chaperone for outer membrane proteins